MYYVIHFFIFLGLTEVWASKASVLSMNEIRVSMRRVGWDSQGEVDVLHCPILLLCTWSNNDNKASKKGEKEA